MSNILYLASQSSARHKLLTQAKIPFVIIPINVQEEDAQVSGTVQEQVEALAEYKHAGIDLAQVCAQHNPPIDKPLFFLTADSLIAGCTTGTIYGKPQNRAHATQMIKEIGAQAIEVFTGMCLSIWHHDAATGRWQQSSKITWSAGAQCQFTIPDKHINTYLDACPTAMLACGATVVEEIGIRYFVSINGSYTGTLGIDLYSLSEHLSKHNFF